MSEAQVEGEVTPYDIESAEVAVDAWGGADEVSASCVDERRALRRLANADSHLPLRVVGGGAPPYACGQDAYHTTVSGKTIVYHPNAYKWPTVRHCSTRRVEVGINWLVAWRLKGGAYG
jgi:hypothetical protein